MLILASSSPRRIEILEGMGIPFRSVAPSAAEVIMDDPVETVLTNALNKAESVYEKFPDKPVLASDTVVYLDEILIKPSSESEAFSMLSRLSGRKHIVYTGTVLIHGSILLEHLDFAFVYFRYMGDEEIQWYISTGEPMDKAGAYAVQGKAARFIRKIEGDFFTVVGLSPYVVCELLRRADLTYLCRNP